MKNLCRVLLALLFLTTKAVAYGAPLGLYVLEYPVKMPDVSLINEQNKTEPILNTSADLTILIAMRKDSPRDDKIFSPR